MGVPISTLSSIRLTMSKKQLAFRGALFGLSSLVLLWGCESAPPPPPKKALPPGGLTAQGVPRNTHSISANAVDDDGNEIVTPTTEPTVAEEKPMPAEPKEVAAEPAAKAETKTILLGSPELTSGIPGEGPVTLAQAEEWLKNPDVHTVLTPELPLGLSLGKIPADVLANNPLTKAKIELGRQLYFDTRLSSDNTISCASCHNPAEGYAAHTQFGVGVKGQQGGRNSPVSYNRILSHAQFWDGRAGSLEEQAIGPIANPIEMGNTHAAAVETLKANPVYAAQFAAVFPEEGVQISTVGKAIAAFERVLVTGPAPYDYHERLTPFAKLTEEDFADDPDLKKEFEEKQAAAEAHPMSESAKRGQALFFSERVNCAHCHVGANFADELYHNLGIGMDKPEPDLGRFVVTKVDKDRGAFKTPTIRNVAQTAPYMHDGSLKTLLEVVEHYNKGGTPNSHLSPKVTKLNLTEQEKLDLVAFMEAVTGDFPPVQTGRLPE